MVTSHQQDIGQSSNIKNDTNKSKINSCINWEQTTFRECYLPFGPECGMHGWEMHTGLWWGNLNEWNHLEDIQTRG